ncbi:MAG: hypothetical protein KAS71_12840, partial [Bacteroidales bacterium]|nr:hypothetical protein [Bacteroidales bacterium]
MSNIFRNLHKFKYYFYRIKVILEYVAKLIKISKNDTIGDQDLSTFKTDERTLSCIIGHFFELS